LRPAKVSLIRACVVCRQCAGWHSTVESETTRLIRELFELFCCQIVESDCLVHTSIIPLSVFIVEALCSKLVNDCTTQQVEYSKTCGLVQPSNDIEHRPTMGSRDSRVCTAFEQGSQKIAVFLAFGTPVCRQLLEYTVVCKSE
jgi:hypothetical protein